MVNTQKAFSLKNAMELSSPTYYDVAKRKKLSKGLKIFAMIKKMRNLISSDTDKNVHPFYSLKAK